MWKFLIIYLMFSIIGLSVVFNYASSPSPLREIATHTEIIQSPSFLRFIKALPHPTTKQHISAEELSEDSDNNRSTIIKDFISLLFYSTLIGISVFVFKISRSFPDTIPLYRLHRPIRIP